MSPSSLLPQVSLSPKEGKAFRVEGRSGVPSLDTAYFAVRIFDSGRPHAAPLRRSFPQAGRGADVRKLHLRSFLARQAEGGVPFRDTAADFDLLLYAAPLLPPELLAAVCDAIAPRLRGRALSPRQEEAAASAFREAERLLYEHAGLPPPEPPAEEVAEADSPLMGCLAGLRRLVASLMGGPPAAALEPGRARDDGVRK